MARRALELGAAVEAWWKLGGVVAFMTFTVRHDSGDSLDKVWRGISLAWRRATSGKSWIADRETFGVGGYVRVIEVTQGRNGWHVHAHVLVFMRELSEETGLAAHLGLHASMFQRWAAGARAGGLRAPLKVAQDVQLVRADAAGRRTLAEYLTKSQQYSKVGQELTNAQSKRARRGNSTRSVWDILIGARDGLDREVGLWGVWETVSKGKRQIAWSRGLRELLALGKEESDEVVAAEEVGTVDDTLAWIFDAGWRRLTGLELLAECLAAARAGQPSLLGFLSAHGIDHAAIRPPSETVAEVC